MPARYDRFPQVRPLALDFVDYADGGAWMFTTEDGISDFDAFAAVAHQWAVAHCKGFRAARYPPIMKGEPDRVMIQFLTAPAHRDDVGCPVYSRCVRCWPGQEQRDTGPDIC